MRQILLILSVHLFLFLVLFAYHAQAEEDLWYVEEFDTFVVTAKNGEVTHGDKLRFFMNKGDCSRMGILFSFTTMKINREKIRKDQELIRYNRKTYEREQRYIYWVDPYKPINKNKLGSSQQWRIEKKYKYYD